MAKNIKNIVDTFVSTEVQVPQNPMEVELKKLNSWVLTNWEALMIGARRLGDYIEGDYYAPERVQIDNLRLNQGIKILGGFHVWHDPIDILTPEDILEAVSALTKLVNAAEEEYSSTIEVIEK